MTKIKQSEIARELGLSKGTVSLALNGKGGVNEQTRQKVLQKREELIRRCEAEARRKEQSIAVVVVNHHKDVFYDPQMDLLTPVIEVFQQGCRDRGYQFLSLYLDEHRANNEEMIRRCNADSVAGIILMGTEMEPADHWLCDQIHKPLLVWDYDIPDKFLNSVTIDNTSAVEMACRMLWDAGARNIVYLALDKDIYNFAQRRKAFYTSMMHRGRDVSLTDIIRTGVAEEQITAAVQRYLTQNGIPDAFLMENFEVSIGTLKALKRRGIRTPEDIKLAGIDIVPDGSTGDVKLTQIGIQHAERANLAMHMLSALIKSNNRSRGRLLGIPYIVEGNTI